MNKKIAPVSFVVLLVIAGLASRIVVGQENSGDQPEEPLPIGLALSSQMQDLLGERLERINELVLDHKLRKAEQHEARLQLIMEHHEMIQESVRQWQEEFRSLVQRFESGEISRAEFSVEREALRSRMREADRLFGHLGQQLQESLRESQGPTDLGRRISELNQDIAERIRELHSQLQEERRGPDNRGQGQGNEGEGRGNRGGHRPR